MPRPKAAKSDPTRAHVWSVSIMLCAAAQSETRFLPRLEEPPGPTTAGWPAYRGQFPPWLCRVLFYCACAVEGLSTHDSNIGNNRLTC